MAAGPQIENFDIFGNDVRLGISQSDMAAAPDPLAGYKAEVSKLTPELQEQVEKATRVLRASAFPPKFRFPMVDSSSNGTMEALNNGLSPNLYNQMPRLYPSPSSQFAKIFGDAQMQSPIIYEKPKKSLREFVAEKFKRMLK